MSAPPVSTQATALPVVDEATSGTVPSEVAALLTLPLIPSWLDSRGRLPGRPVSGRPWSVADVRRWLP